MRYTFESVKIVPSVTPRDAAAGAIEGAAVDTYGFKDAMAVVGVGATTGSPSSFSVNAKVQESSTGVDGWTDITGAAITAVVAANKSAEIPVSLFKRNGAKRYIRLHVTPAFVAGSTPKVGVYGTIVLGNPERGSKAANSVVGN